MSATTPTEKPTAYAVATALNSHLHGGTCPGEGALGECPACYELERYPGRFYAHVYVWKAGQEQCLKAATVASWCEAAGAGDIVISQHLHDPDNETLDGVCHDGALSWLVEFSL
jgi:hypothetical protein